MNRSHEQDRDETRQGMCMLTDADQGGKTIILRISMGTKCRGASNRYQHVVVGWVSVLHGCQRGLSAFRMKK